MIRNCSRKKLITNTKDSELPSSVHAGQSNDDLLLEMLFRLPAVSLYLFKVESTCWLSLIEHTSFTMQRNQIPNLGHPNGLFIRNYYTSPYEFMSLDSIIPSRNITFGIDTGIEILQSCNGLLLCCSCLYPDKLYIYNPSVNLFKMLPKLQNQGFLGGGGVRMIFDLTKSPDYKVMYAERIGNSVINYYYQIQIYSSQTCNWRVFCDRFPMHSFIKFIHGVYCNDAIRWLPYLCRPSHSKLDIADNLVITDIKNPLPLDQRCKLFVSHGCLLLLGWNYDHSRTLNIYEMRNGYSEWSVKYRVNLDDISRSLQREITVWGIVLDETEDDLFLLIKLSQKIVKYKIVSKTLHTLRDSLSISAFGYFQFIAFFACVTMFYGFSC